MAEDSRKLEGGEEKERGEKFIIAVDEWPSWYISGFLAVQIALNCLSSNLVVWNLVFLDSF